MFRLWAQGFAKIRSWILSKIWKLGLVKILSLSLFKFLKLKFYQNLCQKLWYELNPRVRCAFGNVWTIIDGYSLPFSDTGSSEVLSQLRVFHPFQATILNWPRHFQTDGSISRCCLLFGMEKFWARQTNLWTMLFNTKIYKKRQRYYLVLIFFYIPQ